MAAGAAGASIRANRFPPIRPDSRFPRKSRAAPLRLVFGGNTAIRTTPDLGRCDGPTARCGM